MRPEYDFSQLKGRVRGKYAERYREGTNLVLLDPDVAAAFPDAKAVNEALRLLMDVAQRHGLQQR
jgi:primosomal protein N'